MNLSFEFISLILRDLSLSSRVFYLGNGHLTIPCGKNPKNLSEISSENKQNKLKTQVMKKRRPISLLFMRENLQELVVFGSKRAL